MHWLRNKKIVVKMGILIGLMSVFLAVVGLAGYIYFNQASDFIDHFYNEDLISVQIINQARSDSNALKSATLTLTSYTLDNETKKAQLDQIDTRENSIDKFIKDYQALATNAFEQDKLQKIKANFQTIKEINRKAINYSQNGNKIEAQDYYLKNGFSKQDEFQSLLRELGTFNVNEAKEQATVEKNKIAVVKRILLVLPVMVIIISIIVGIVITRMITVPINRVVAIIKEIADGNLTVEDLKLHSNDEVGILANGVTMMTGNIRRLISQVATTAEQLSKASVELTASAEQQALASNQVSVAIRQVASGTEQQSYAIDNTSSAIEQMSAAIQEMAASSHEVAEQANNTALASKEGRKVVGEAVNQMEKVGYVTAEVQIAVDELEQGSKKIGEITNVISGIAAQTNLLALNAAIEAARAGEQGRGFAVVAEEVRKLAEQSKVAAEQITTLVNNNQANIDNAVKAMQAGTADVKIGIEVVNSAGETFVQIASSINQVVSQIQDVSVSVEEMANSSQLILSSVNQIEGISKENLAQSQSVSDATEEQTASSTRIEATSQTLAKMVQVLQVGINKFKL